MIKKTDIQAILFGLFILLGIYCHEKPKPVIYSPQDIANAVAELERLKADTAAGVFSQKKTRK